MRCRASNEGGLHCTQGESQRVRQVRQGVEAAESGLRYAQAGKDLWGKYLIKGESYPGR